MPNKNNSQTIFHYYAQADVQDDVTFGGYEVTSKNPGPALIYFTLIVCLILFLIGILFIPGSPVPMEKIIETIKGRLSGIKLTTTSSGGTPSSTTSSDDEESSKNIIMTRTPAFQYSIHRTTSLAAEVDNESSYTKRYDERYETPSGVKTKQLKTIRNDSSCHSSSADGDNSDKVLVTVARTGARGKKKHTPRNLTRRNSLCLITVQQKQQQQCPQPATTSNMVQRLSDNLRGGDHNEKVSSNHQQLNDKSSSRNHYYANGKQVKSSQNTTTGSENKGPLTEDSNHLTFDDLLFHMTRFNSVGTPPSMNQQQVEYSTDDKRSTLLEENLLEDSTSEAKEKTKVDISILRNEMRVIMRWAAPWALQSAVSYGEDILTIIIISHFMGLRAMLCYSNVWFIVKLMHIINDAWYSAIYKYVNVVCAQESDEAYTSAGRLISVGMIGNIVMSIPFSIITVLFMPDIMKMLGYEESIIDLSQGYALIAVINRIFSSTSDILSSILDLEGYAKFNAVFDFWTSLCDLVVVLIFVVWSRPSLKALGVCHLILDLISTGIFYYMTINKGCFEAYTKGIFECLDISASASDVRAVGAAIIPLAGQEIIENIEYIIFTIFAAYQGPAEVATWVLISYVWDFVELLSESFAEAAAYKVSRHLARGKLELAQAVSFYTIKVGILINVIFSFVLYLFGPFFVWCLSLDDTLDRMLLEVIPYVVTCQPFIAVGMIMTEILNEALFVYKKLTASLTIATVFIMIPVAAINTYWLKFNIEGLASAQCIGHTAAGVASIVLFMSADWDRALYKAQRNS